MAASVITLHEQREVFARATTPGRSERLFALCAVGLILVAAVLFVVGVVAHDGWPALAAMVALGFIGFLWERRTEMRRKRLRLWPAIRRNRPAAVRLALYVLQPQFEDIEVLADSEVIEVLADPFTLNAAERDFELEARLDDARVRYERVDEYTAPAPLALRRGRVMTRPQRSKRGRGFRNLSARVIDQDTCSKRAWPTYVDANRALARARIVRREGGHRDHFEKRAYRCPRCGFWHLTSISGIAA